MPETEIEALRGRLAAAGAELGRLHVEGPGTFGAPDPETGERWNSGNLLGHVAEALPFWGAQVRAILVGDATAAGRGEPGLAGRREGIDAGALLSEAELRTRAGAAIGGAQDLLASMSDSDLDREIVLRTEGGERRIQLGRLVEQMIVGHLEAHLKQLAELA